MRLDEMIPVLETAFQVGYMEAVKAYEPPQDMLRKTELKKWLALMHIDKRRVQALIDKGLVKPYRKGTGKNSPLYFSKIDIKKAIAAADIAATFTSQEL